VVATTGGGATAVAWLTSVPGGSQSLIDAAIPYSREALEALFGMRCQTTCTAETSRQMAMAAWQHAAKLAGQPRSQLIGIGATAALRSDRPKRGEHRVHASWQTAFETGTLSLVLDKGHRTRLAEEQIASDLVLSAMARSLHADFTDMLLTDNDRLSVCQATGDSAISELLLGDKPLACFGVHPDELAECVVLAGSFNPLHRGHRRMAEVASQLTRRKAVFEISLTNVDKPALDFFALNHRKQQFQSLPFVVTAAPTFVEKSALLPGCIFAVGADTATRLAETQYYAGSLSARDAAIATLTAGGHRFLVFGRLIRGKFEGLDKLHLPPAFRSLCDAVPESLFRDDISSTQLRASQQAMPPT
jgi:hypothetical protein